MNNAKAPFRYVTPTRTRATEYEELTLHCQWSPHNFAKQGWFNLGRDGRPSWDERSTRLKCVALPKPQSWWYDQSRANDQTAVAFAQDHHIEQSAQFSQAGWWGYRDPSQMWFRPYVEMQAGQENSIQLAMDGAARLGLYRNVGEAWLGFLGRYYAAWRYAEYGLFMALCYAQREALSDVVATPYLFQAVDKERHAQDIALHCMALEEQVQGFSDAAAMDTWMDDPVLQPTRRYVEYLLASRDWAEIIFAANLVFEPLVGRLLGNYLMAQQACASGDPVTPLIAETVEADRQRAIATTAELARYVIANQPGNRAIIEEWIDRWKPQAIAAAEALAPLGRYPREDPSNFRKMLDNLIAEQGELIASAGLTRSRVAA